MSRQKRQKAISDASVGISDTYRNLVANIGTGRDKAAHGQHVAVDMSISDLYTLYENNWLANRLVDCPAEDSTRNWRNWQADADQISKIEAIEKKLSLKSKVKEAQIAAGVAGWSVIYINTNQDRQEEPLGINEEIKSLIVLVGGLQVNAGDINKDIYSEYFGNPEFYKFTAKGKEVTVHASRFAVFTGEPASLSGLFTANVGRSKLVAAKEPIDQLSSVLANLSSLAFEAKVGVFKFKGLAEILSDRSRDGARMVADRMSLQAAMKGINGDVVIDTEDEYETRTISFAGFESFVDIYYKNFAGSSRVPLSRLFGREAAGLSGSGEGDERVYFDYIKDIQSDEITPAIRRIDDNIIYQALGSRPDNIYYNWAPLRNKTEVDNAEILGKIATAARTLAGSTAGEIIPIDVLGDAVANTIIESGAMPGLEQAIDKYGNMAEQTIPTGGEDDEI